MAKPSGSDSAGMRFGTGGEYTSPYMATEMARYQFLQGVRRRCPLPLLHLRGRIFPIYSRWVDDFLKRARDYQQWKQSPEGAILRERMIDFFKRLEMTDEGAQVAAEGRPVAGLDADDPVFHTFMILEYEHPRLDHLLKLWAQRHNLTHQREFEEQSEEHTTDTDVFTEMTLHKDYWACQWALATLWSWKFLPEGVKMMNADPPEWVHAFDGSSGPSDEPPFRIRPGWDFLTETESAFRDRVEKALTAYIERSKQLAEMRGLIETREKRQRSHYDWLALYQVKRWSYAQIADWDQVQPGAEAKGEDTIMKGVKSAAQLVQLPVRPGKPGRPKTRKQ